MIAYLTHQAFTWEVWPLVIPDPRAAPYFFLSYARAPKRDLGDPGGPDRWVQKLFDDLCGHVMHMSELPHGARVGFIDQKLRPGSAWMDEMAQAIATCRVFVPLYSRRYFESEICGREWAAFSRRIVRHETLGLGRLMPIVPAIWVPVAMEDLPEVSWGVQTGSSDPASEYEKYGFYGIMKLRRFHSAYEFAVHDLARRIVEAGKNAKLALMEPPDYHSLESAFEPYGAQGSNGQRIRVTVVSPGAAGRSMSPGKLRSETSPEWNPYDPVVDTTLVEHAQNIIQYLGYVPEVDLLTGFDPPAEAQPSPRILLLDVRAVESVSILRSPRWLDESGEQWVAVILVTNRADPETAQAEARLRGLLEGGLRKKMATGRVTQSAVTVVSSIEEFSRAIAETARSIVVRYLRHAPAHPPEGRSSIERPRLQGIESPYGADDAEARYE